jgi:hypothetical protein
MYKTTLKGFGQKGLLSGFCPEVLGQKFWKEKQ